MPTEGESTRPGGVPTDGSGLNLILYRLDQIERKLDKQARDDGEWKERYEARLSALELGHARINERLTLWNAVQTVYTTIAGIIAGLFGRAP